MLKKLFLIQVLVSLFLASFFAGHRLLAESSIEEEYTVMVYPGAVLNEELTVRTQKSLDRTNNPKSINKTYVTKDDFKQVVNFYDRIYTNGYNAALGGDAFPMRVYSIKDSIANPLYQIFIDRFYDSEKGWLDLGGEYRKYQDKGFKTFITIQKFIGY